MSAGPGSSPARTIFIGTGGFGLPALRALAEVPDVDLVAVITAPARPAGRRAVPTSSPVAVASLDLGVPLLTPERLRAPDAISAALDLRPDLVVLADYGQIVPRELLAVRYGALNLHPSLLPRHRGAVPVAATILAGEPRTGVTLMQMDEGLDTGPIVAVDEIDLVGDEVAPALEHVLADRAAELLARSIVDWLRGAIVPQPQPRDGATLTRRLGRDDGRLDPSRSASELERQVRAFQPWPGSWLELPSGHLVVLRAAVRPRGANGEMGSLGPVDGRPVLVTADGSLELVEVQPAGGRPMSGEAWLRGRPRLEISREHGSVRPPVEVPVGYSTRP